MFVPSVSKDTRTVWTSVLSFKVLKPQSSYWREGVDLRVLGVEVSAIDAADVLLAPLLSDGKGRSFFPERIAAPRADEVVFGCFAHVVRIPFGNSALN